MNGTLAGLIASFQGVGAGGTIQADAGGAQFALICESRDTVGSTIYSVSDRR